MTALGQIRHVMMKDIREARWPLSAYAVIVAVATARALSWSFVSNQIFESSSLFVVVAGMVLVALLVQSDSPTRTDAFWASRPLYPWAVVTAKLSLVVMLVIGPALVGQFLGLLSHAVSPSPAALDLVPSAWQYAFWLLVAMIVAALTRDLRTFLIVLIATPLFFLFVPSLLLTFGRPVLGWTITIAPLIAAGGGLLLLFRLYQTRDSRRRIRAVGIVVVSAALVSIAAASPSIAPAVDDTPAAAISKVPLRIELMNYAKPAERAELTLLLSPGASTTDRLTLVRSVVVVQLPDGSTLRFPYVNQSIELGQPLPPPQAGVTWLGESRGDPNSRVQMSVALNGEQRHAVAGGIKSVAIEGTVEVREPHLVATIPLEPGAAASRDGREIRVTSSTHGFGDASVEVVSSSVVSKGEYVSSSSFWGGAIHYALLNSARGEALALVQKGSSDRSGWLVLPGMDRRLETLQLQSSQRGPGAPPLTDDAWFRSLRLMIWNWNERGWYPIRAEFVVPRDSTR